MHFWCPRYKERYKKVLFILSSIERVQSYSFWPVFFEMGLCEPGLSLAKVCLHTWSIGSLRLNMWSTVWRRILCYICKPWLNTVIYWFSRPAGKCKYASFTLISFIYCYIRTGFVTPILLSDGIVSQCSERWYLALLSYLLWIFIALRIITDNIISGIIFAFSSHPTALFSVFDTFGNV